MMSGNSGAMRRIFSRASFIMLAAGTAWAAPFSVLEEAFVCPPDSAKPWVYWFWSDGNMTKEGVTADLEAMKRVGIGGVLIMEVDQGIPAGPVRFMSSQWRDLFRLVLAEADRLGLEVNMNNDGGWTGSGGPWVKAEHAMQMLVFSETHVHGPAKVDRTLAQPKTVEGFYRDVAVLAYPTPAAEGERMADAKPTLTCSSAKDFDAARLLDGTLNTGVSVKSPDPKQPVHLRIEFEKPFPATALTLSCDEWRPGWIAPFEAAIEASDNGTDYRLLHKFTVGWPTTCVNFDRTSARHYRLAMTGVSSAVTLTEIDLAAAPRIPELSGRAAYLRQDHLGAVVATVGANVAIERAKILDISSQLDKSGRLTWDAPAGAWTILRIGHTPTGRKNAPAPKESIGHECDKLSREAVEAHFDGMIGKLVADQKALGGKALRYTHIDSWEVGSQNWTPRFREEFRTRRGYDPLAYLPTVAGRFVESREVTDRFLWDFRRTIGDLVADCYAGCMREVANRHGLQLSIEAYGDCVFDNLTYAGRCDIPMSEFWVGGGALTLGKAMSSAAHTYGRPLVQAEAFTAFPDVGKWQDHPEALKALGDRAFCMGINRFVVHRYAMQPWMNRWPGMTMGPWGIHFERTSTWWDKSPAWLRYLARCQHILQSGRFVADIAYLYGEGAPNDLPPRENLQPPIPDGYDYDGCSPEIVLTRMSVRDGRLVLPDGMSYAVLVLPPGDTMTPALLRKLKTLVEAGATVVGPRPTRSPSLANYPACDDEVRTLAAELWGDCNGATVLEHRLGKGRIVWGKPLEKVLGEMNVPPDLSTQADLVYLHRVVDGADLYFVANPRSNAAQAACTFRVVGRRPEFWDAETGRIEPAAVYAHGEAGTRVLLTLPQNGSVFVVFRREDRHADPVVAIARDGKTLANVAAARPPRIVIDKAVYGVLDDPARTQDVREAVQQRVDAGERRFNVAELAKADDPAPSMLKTLIVEYTAGERKLRVCATDNDAIHLRDDVARVVVKTAVYGVLDDPARRRDVTRKVQQIIDTGETSFPVARLAHGDDPAFGVPKTLMIECTINGKPAALRGSDGEFIRLIVPAAFERAIDIRAGEDGRLSVEAWQPGPYELRFASGRMRRIDVPQTPATAEVAGPWQVRFPAGWGAPERITLDTLVSLSRHTEPGVKYFSGTATYARSLHVSADMLGKDRRLYLDLGRVCVMADVKLNGKALGLVWKTPFLVDITDAVKPGANALEVETTNLWPNRLIGDEQLPDDCERNGQQIKAWPPWLLDGRPSPTGRVTFATWKHYDKDSPLQEAGLIGPVQLRSTLIRAFEP